MDVEKIRAACERTPTFGFVHSTPEADLLCCETVREVWNLGVVDPLYFISSAARLLEARFPGAAWRKSVVWDGTQWAASADNLAASLVGTGPTPIEAAADCVLSAGKEERDG